MSKDKETQKREISVVKVDREIHKKIQVICTWTERGVEEYYNQTLGPIVDAEYTELVALAFKDTSKQSK